MVRLIACPPQRLYRNLPIDHAQVLRPICTTINIYKSQNLQYIASYEYSQDRRRMASGALTGAI